MSPRAQSDNTRPADPLHGGSQSKHSRQAGVSKPAQASGEDQTVCVCVGGCLVAASLPKQFCSR